MGERTSPHPTALGYHPWMDMSMGMSESSGGGWFEFCFDREITLYTIIEISSVRMVLKYY
jgi:hypothetical protein